MSSVFPYAQLGAKLLSNLRRADWLPEHDEDAVRRIVAETDEISEKYESAYSDWSDCRNVLQTSLEAFGSSLDAPVADDEPEQLVVAREREASLELSVCLLSCAIERNKRALLIYYAYRSDKIRESRKRSGDATLARAKRSKLCESEIGFHRQYDSLLTDYMDSVNTDLLSDASPPRELFVEVVVKEDLGDVLLPHTGSAVTLTKNTTHYLRRADVEHLITQGRCQVRA